MLGQWSLGPQQPATVTLDEDARELVLHGSTNTFRGLYQRFTPCQPKGLEATLALGGPGVHLVLAEKQVTWAVRRPVVWLELEGRELRLLRTEPQRPHLLVLKPLGQVPARFGNWVQVRVLLDWARGLVTVEWLQPRGREAMTSDPQAFDPRGTSSVLCVFAKGQGQARVKQVRLLEPHRSPRCQTCKRRLLASRWAAADLRRHETTLRRWLWESWEASILVSGLVVLLAVLAHACLR